MFIFSFFFIIIFFFFGKNLFFFLERIYFFPVYPPPHPLVYVSRPFIPRRTSSHKEEKIQDEVQRPEEERHDGVNDSDQGTERRVSKFSKFHKVFCTTPRKIKRKRSQ